MGSEKSKNNKECFSGFSVGDLVKVKRSSGVWEDGEIIELFPPFGVAVLWCCSKG